MRLDCDKLVAHAARDHDAHRWRAVAPVDHKIAAAVKAEVSPLNAKVNSSNQGLAAIIQSNINQLESEVGDLAYIRDYQPLERWTSELNAQYIAKSRQLEVQRQALASIRGSQ